MACHDDPPIAFSIREESQTQDTIAKASDVQERTVRLIGGLIQSIWVHQRIEAIAIAVLWIDRFEPTERNSYRKAGTSLGGSVKCVSGLTLKLKFACDPYDEI